MNAFGFRIKFKEDNMWTSDYMITDPRMFSGIICGGTASYYYRLSNFPPNPISFYEKASIPLRGRMVVTYPVKELDYTDTKHLGGKLHILSVERTICDLIILRYCEEFIYQSIHTYARDNGNLEYILEYSKKWGVQDKLEYYIETEEKYWTESQGIDDPDDYGADDDGGLFD
jgi:hypothetical protein